MVSFSFVPILDVVFCSCTNFCYDVLLTTVETKPIGSWTLVLPNCYLNKYFLIICWLPPLFCCSNTKLSNTRSEWKWILISFYFIHISWQKDTLIFLKKSLSILPFSIESKLNRILCFSSKLENIWGCGPSMNVWAKRII